MNTLDKISRWLIRNKLALNARKCEFLLVGSRRRLNSISVPSVKIKGEVQSRIIIISKERVKISLQIGSKIMKIG